jgi:site-specific DNA recombinase
MRAAIYCRVSTDRQRERHTIGSQLSELPAFVARMGWTVVETYIDDGISGETVEGRPAFRKLLEDAAASSFDVLVVVDLDRITRARRSAEGALIYDHLRESHVKIATPSQGLIDLDDEDQDLLVGIKRELAKWEKRKILGRVTRGWREAARQGRKPRARDPYALRFTRDPAATGGGRWEVVPEEAALVGRIFGEAIAGHGVEEIALTLRAEGRVTRSGTPWHPVAVHRVLRSATVRGHARYRVGGDHIDVPVPRLVDDETWEAAQRSIDARRTFAGRAPASECLVAKLVRCGECGRTMTVRRSLYGPTGRLHVYYACMSTYVRRTGVEPCGNRYHATEEIDGLVWGRLRTLLVEDDAFAAEAAAGAGEPQPTVDPAATRRALASLVTAEREVLGRRRRGLLSAAACDGELVEIAAERGALEAQLAEHEARRLDGEVRRLELRDAAAQVAAMATALEAAPFEERQQLVRLIVPRRPGFGVTIHASGDIEIAGILAEKERSAPLLNPSHQNG